MYSPNPGVANVMPIYIKWIYMCLNKWFINAYSYHKFYRIRVFSQYIGKIY